MVTEGVPRQGSGLQKKSDSLFQRSGRIEAFNFYADDAVAFHLENGVAAVIVFKAFAAFGDFAELRHHEAGQRFKAFFTRQSDVILVFKVAQIEAAIEHHGTGREGDGRALSDVKFVFKLADDLLQYIFHGDKAADGAKFIDHNGEMAFAFLKFNQKIVERFAFRNEEHFTHDVADFEIAGVLGKNVTGRKGASA